LPSSDSVSSTAVTRLAIVIPSPRHVYETNVSIGPK
jgi:hypothetical protein